MLARVFAPQRMGMMLLLGIGGLAFVGVPMNALFLQDGRHPAPLFSARALAPQKDADAPAALERADRPETARIETQPARTEIVRPEIAPPVAKPGKSDAVALKALLSRPDAVPAAKADKRRDAAARDPIAAMLGDPKAPTKSKAQAQAHAQTPAKSAAQAPRNLTQAPKAQNQAQAQGPSDSVASAQRALQRLGYVVKPDGVVSAGTKQAIEKFERENGLPAKGELTPKIVRLLATRAAAPRQ